MKKLLYALALLALMMVLCPMQKAKASGNYRQCPNCSEYQLESSWYDDNQHRVFCWACNYEALEDHFGGTALCYDNAICEGCDSRYGEWAPHNWATTLSHDETYDYYACTNEGCTWRDEISLHDWGDWTKVDEENHTRTCKRGCGATETVAHVWNGSHWCGYARKCKDCGEFYGEVLDHEYWYEYKTDEQHKINCYHCDTFFGREDHSGGTATCTAKAVCEKCGEEYGGYAHDWGDWAVDPNDSSKHTRTCKNNCGATESHAISWGAWSKEDEENHTHVCTVDGCGVSETVAHVWNGSHWCGYARKCKDCGEFYGEVLDHEYWYEYKTDEQHKINCYHCDTFFGREDHSGGTATCTAKAVCEKCNEEYGEPKGHDWSDWAVDPNDSTKHTRTCKNNCGATETHAISWSDWAKTDDQNHAHSCTADGCTVTETEAHDWKDWTFTVSDTAYHHRTCKQGCGAAEIEAHNEEKLVNLDDSVHAIHCSICELPIRPEEHKFGDWTDAKDGANHKRSCICGREETEPHTGGTATCVARAKCTVCGEEYGELGRHSPVADAAVEPTYTETGLTAGSHCRVCGAVLVEQEIVPMLVDPLLIAGEDVTGFVEYQGGIFLVEKGRVLTTANGLVNDPAQPAIWYFLSRGQAQLDYTGLAYYDGEWFYVRGGRLDTSLNAFVAYDGGLFLVAAGRVVREASGLIMNPDRSGWYYCANGQAQTQYTGLARYDGHWFYVVSGKLDAGFNGIVTYNGAQFRVAGGQMIEQVI